MSALPTGTLTFLFTDIQGSTRLWEDFPDAMRAALARHDALLRQHIEAGGGQVFKTGGDAFYAVFPSAPQAVAAALSAQRALHAEPWPVPPERPLRVRMALHSGLAELRDGDYFGGVLSRASRLLGAAHGGQSLVSESAASLTGDALPPDAGLRSLGRHRLKDLTQPQEIFQLLHPALPAAFPPLRSLESVAHNLPSQLTSFVGREGEMTEARALLNGSRLLTLTGMGGAGKSRLAVQMAAECLEDFPDGIWLVELAALTDPTLVPQAVAAALGLREEPDKRLEETLIQTLRPQTLLLVLDNCEHLILACARLAENLLRGCPLLRILATSREALGIGGEVTLPLSSLSLPSGPSLPPSDMLTQFDSVRLFVDRATTAQPAFRFSAGNATAVAQVCSRLDGIPLALELAAARVKVLSPEQIVSRLDDRFRLLSGGSRTALPRQQTLRALIDWSYDLLPASEQTLLRRLSVFAGGWSLDAAEAVCSGGAVEDWEVLDLLSHLVSKSLIVVEPPEDGQVRYHLLENLRQYARERLGETEEAATLPGRHRDWFLAFSEQAAPHITEPEQATWLNCLERDHDNLRAALRYSQDKPGVALARLTGALSQFWFARSYLSEGLHWLETALAQPVDVSTKALSDLGNQAGVLAWSLGDYTKATELHKMSLELQRQEGSPLGIAHSLTNLGIVASLQGDYPQARRHYEESLSLYRQAKSTHNITTVLHNLGGLALDQGDLQAARPLLEESLTMFAASHDIRGMAAALHNLGDIAFREGRFNEACSHFQKSLRAQQDLGDKQRIASTLEAIAHVACGQGEYARAVYLLSAADSILRASDIPRLAADQRQFDRALAQARSELGEGRFQASWLEGATTAVEQLIDYVVAHFPS